MSKKIISLLSLVICTAMLATPIIANTDSRSGNGRTEGSTFIYSVGNGGYKQAQVQTTTGRQVNTISVSANYYIVNSYSVGNPSDSNRWSTKAYAQLTYEGSKVMGCSTTHIANGDSYVKFNTSDMY